MRYPGPLLALLLAGPAAAEPWGCVLTVECDTLGCASIDATLDVIAADHEGQLFLVSPEGDRPVVRLGRADDPTAAYAGTSSATPGELLTIAPDGRATLTRHGGGGALRTTTAFGTCNPL